MNISQVPRKSASETPKPLQIEMKLEVVALPVAVVDRSKRFYGELGWRLDIDFAGEKFRVVQYTPYGSSCSVIFGEGITRSTPGSVQGPYLIVSDIAAARDELINRGVAVSEVLHDAGGVFHHVGRVDRLNGPQPERRSYASYASFSDPDGNGWLFQEVTARLPGHVDTDVTTFTSSVELEGALRRAAARHSQHERKVGDSDSDWAARYAKYIVREQTGKA